jgi:hypothetical protein
MNVKRRKNLLLLFSFKDAKFHLIANTESMESLSKTNRRKFCGNSEFDNSIGIKMNPTNEESTLFICAIEEHCFTNKPSSFPRFVTASHLSDAKNTTRFLSGSIQPNFKFKIHTTFKFKFKFKFIQNQIIHIQIIFKFKFIENQITNSNNIQI